MVLGRAAPCSVASNGHAAQDEVRRNHPAAASAFKAAALVVDRNRKSRGV